MKPLTKLTAKAVNEKKVTSALLGDKEQVDLMTVYGTVVSWKDGFSDMPDGKQSAWRKFFGEFAAVRTRDGEEFRSREMLLPPVAEGVISAIIDREPENKITALGFAFLIGIRASDVPAGYVWTAEVLTEPEEDDPLTRMRKQLESGKKLIAPKRRKKEETANEILTELEESK